MIHPYQIIIFSIILLSLVVTALVLASKSKSNTRFLIWGVFILFVPIIGALACILNYYTTKKLTKTA